MAPKCRSGEQQPRIISWAFLSILQGVLLVFLTFCSSPLLVFLILLVFITFWDTEASAVDRS